MYPLPSTEKMGLSVDREGEKSDKVVQSILAQELDYKDFLEA